MHWANARSTATELRDKNLFFLPFFARILSFSFLLTETKIGSEYSLNVSQTHVARFRNSKNLLEGRWSLRKKGPPGELHVGQRLRIAHLEQIMVRLEDCAILGWRKFLVRPENASLAVLAPRTLETTARTPEPAIWTRCSVIDVWAPYDSEKL